MEALVYGIVRLAKARACSRGPWIEQRAPRIRPVFQFTYSFEHSTWGQDALFSLLQQVSYHSSSLNHSLLMHSVHFLPSLELEGSTLIWGIPHTALDNGTHRLCPTATQHCPDPLLPIHLLCLAVEAHSHEWNVSAHLWYLLCPTISSQSQVNSTPTPMCVSLTRKSVWMSKRCTLLSSLHQRAIRAGEGASGSTSDVWNLPTSWPVCVSQTRTWESLRDRHTKSFPSSGYLGRWIHTWSLKMKLGSVVILWITTWTRQSNHWVPGVGIL